MSQSRLVALRTKTRISSPRRLFVNLKKSSFVKNQEDVLLVKLASLSPLHVLTPISGFPASRLANCGLSGTSSLTNSCHSPILNLYSLNMTCVLLTIPSVRSPRTPRGLVSNSPQLQVRDLVYLVADKEVSGCDRYIVVSTEPPWCFVKKFSGSQLRASFYKVKLSECFPVPPSVVVSNHPGLPVYQYMDEEPLPLSPAAPAAPVQPPLSPPAPPELTTMPSDDEQSSSLASADTTLDVPFYIPSPVIIPEEPCTNVVATDQSSSSCPCSSPEPPCPRPQRQRRPPSYLNDYVRF